MKNKVFMTVAILIVSPAAVWITLSAGAEYSLSIATAVLALAGWSIGRGTKLIPSLRVLAGLVGVLVIVMSWPGAPSFVLLIATFGLSFWLGAIGAGSIVLLVGLAFSGLAAWTQAEYVAQDASSVLAAAARAFILVTSLFGVLNRKKDAFGKLESARAFVVLATIVLAAFYISVWTGLPVRNYSELRRSGYLGASGDARPNGWASSPNEMALILALVTISALVFLVLAPGAHEKAMSLIAIFSLVGVSMTSTRSAVLGLVVGIISFAALRSTSRLASRRKRILFGASIAAFSGILAFGFAGRDLFGRSDDGSAIYRSAVIQRVTDRLVAGEGTAHGSGLIAGNQLAPNALSANIEVVDGSVFYLAGWVGLVGAVFIVLVMLGVLIYLLVAQSLALPLLATFVTISFFENSVAWPTSLLLLAVLGGLNDKPRDTYRVQRAIRESIRID